MLDHNLVKPVLLVLNARVSTQLLLFVTWDTTLLLEARHVLSVQLDLTVLILLKVLYLFLQLVNGQKLVLLISNMLYQANSGLLMMCAQSHAQMVIILTLQEVAPFVRLEVFALHLQVWKLLHVLPVTTSHSKDKLPAVCALLVFIVTLAQELFPLIINQLNVPMANTVLDLQHPVTLVQPVTNAQTKFLPQFSVQKTTPRILVV